MTENNKTNEAIHLQKPHPSSKVQNHAGGGATCHLSPRWVEPKPSTGGVAHGGLHLCNWPGCPWATGTGDGRS
jgi:hypothetical protein